MLMVIFVLKLRYPFWQLHLKFRPFSTYQWWRMEKRFSTRSPHIRYYLKWQFDIAQLILILSGTTISVIKKLSRDRLIFIMIMSISGRRHLSIETALWPPRGVSTINDWCFASDEYSCYATAIGTWHLALLLSNRISLIHGSRILIKITLLSTVSHLQLPNFVSCGRACPSHMKQNLVTVGAKLWTAEPFLVDPWSMD